MMQAARRTRVCPGLVTAVVFAVSGPLGPPGPQAADVIKADNERALAEPASWTLGVAPGTDGVGVWGRSVAAANAVALGGDLSWQGLRLADPGGDVTLSGPNTLTLGSAGLDTGSAVGLVYAASGTLDLNGPLAGSTSFTLANDTPQDWTGMDGVSFTGSLVLRGGSAPAGSFAGNWLAFGSSTVVQTGSFVLDTGAALEDRGELMITDGWGDGTTRPKLTVAALTGFGDIRSDRGPASIRTLVVDQDGETTFAGRIVSDRLDAQAINLEKAGTGRLRLTGASSINATTVTAGTLTVAEGGGIGGGRRLEVAAGATFEWAKNGSVSGSISGAGRLVRSTTTGNALFSGDNSAFTGEWLVSSGNVGLVGDSSIGAAGVGMTLDGGGIYFVIDGSTLAASRRITLGPAGGRLETAAGSTATFAAPITGGGDLTKSGGGRAVLTAANDFSGDLIVAAGTLEIGDAGTLGSPAGQAAEHLYGGGISNAGTLVFASSAPQTIGGVISGPGSLTTSGSGVLTLAGASTLTGPTTVAQGTLVLSAAGSIADSAVTVGGGATLAGAGAAGSTVVASGGSLAPGIAGVGTLTLASLTFGEAATDRGTITMPVTGAGTLDSQIAVLGELAAAGGPASVTFALGPGLARLASGTYTLISHGGSPLADASAFSVSGEQGGRQSVSLAGRGQSIDLVVENALLSWSGAGGPGWSTPANWILSSDGQPTTFQPADTVIFDDSAATGTVELSGSVAPVLVSFSGDTLDYTLGSPGGFRIESGSLLKTGAATVTIGMTNSYAGGTTVLDGTLVAAANEAFGSAGITLGGPAAGGSDVALLGDASAGSVTISGPVAVSAAGTGRVAIGSSRLAAGNEAVFSGPISLGRGLTLTAAAGGDRTEFSGGISGTGDVTVDTAGTGRVILTGSASTFAGNVSVIDNSTLQLSDGTATATSLLPDTATVTVAAGGRLLLAKREAESIDALAGKGTVESVVGTNTLVLGAADGSASFAGVLRDNGGVLAVTKAGSGTQTFTAPNAYTGPTRVSAGILAFTGDNSLGSNLLNAAGETSAVVRFGANTLTIGNPGVDSTGFYFGSLDGTGTVALRGGRATIHNADGTAGTSTNFQIIDFAAAVSPTPFALDTGGSAADRKDFGFINDTGDDLLLTGLSGFGAIRSDAGGTPGQEVARRIVVDQASETTFHGALLSHRSRANARRLVSLEKQGEGSLTLAGFIGTQTVAALAGPAPVDLTANGGILNVTNAANTTTSNAGAIGLGKVTVTSGTLAFSDQALVSTDGSAGAGSILMDGGTLRWNTGTAQDITAGGRLSLVAAKTASFDTNGNDVTLATPFGGGAIAAAVTKRGAGTLTLAAANGYTGPTAVSAGTLEVADAAAIASSAVTVASGGTLAAASGTTIRAPSVTLDGGTLVAESLAVNAATGIETLLVNAGTIAASSSLAVSGGGLASLPAAGRVRLGVAGLDVAASAGGGLLDLGAGELAVAAGGITAAGLRADIIAGRNGGAWNGTTGISSATAAGSGGTRAVGYVMAGDGSARVSFAAPGDTDLSGQVNIIDLVGIDAAGKFGTGQAADWSQGDFNYDGVTTILDLVAIDTAGAFGTGGYFPEPVGATAAGPGGITAVPEPGSLFLAAAGLAGLAAVRSIVLAAAAVRHRKPGDPIEALPIQPR